MPERHFTDADFDAALRALTEPERFRRAEELVASRAPELQHILIQALHEGGWFEQIEESELRKAVRQEDESERVRAVRTLLAEETRMGMLVGVAVGWELARELEIDTRDEGEED